jgi:predicted nucleic acid-binding protein
MIEAERQRLDVARFLKLVAERIGEREAALCSISVAELAHGIYRADTPERRQARRAFLDDLKATVAVYPITADTAELVGKIHGESSQQGITIPPDDLARVCRRYKEPAPFQEDPRAQDHSLLVSTSRSNPSVFQTDSFQQVPPLRWWRRLQSAVSALMPRRLSPRTPSVPRSRDAADTSVRATHFRRLSVAGHHTGF